MNRYKKKIIAIALMVMMFAGCIVPFEFAAYADTQPYTVTWMNYDGSDVLGTYTPEGEDKTPVFNGSEPTWPADEKYEYSFNGWATEKLSESGEKDVKKLPAIPEKGATYYAAFKKTAKPTPAPSATRFTKKTAGFQRVYLEWAPSTSNYGTVYYKVTEEVIDGKGIKTARVIYNGTGTKYTADFDPYPGKATGEAKYGNSAASATANRVNYYVCAYIKDPADSSKTISSAQAQTGIIEVVHPMYVVVKVKGKAKILKTSKSSKSVGKTKKNGYYIAFGGSRIKGENKRVIIKVNGTARYIKAGSVSKYKYVYRSTIGKNYYKGKAGYCYTNQQIEDFINDKKPASNNNFFLYVDTYHQRLYMLTRAYKGARWHIATDYKYHDLLASTGRQLSPYGSYKVANTMARKKTTGTKWWLLFNHIGIHEKLGEKLGKPASGGCIRVPDPASKWFFDHIKKGTGVFIY
ncbi:MAG: L,D-transpeptidase [Mogibacterium sp.]|nr:L,D-transpeptidase [Mogibacterium sp.]